MAIDEGDFEVGTDPRHIAFMNAMATVIDSVHANGAGLAIDEIVSLLVTVAADYGRANYGDGYLDGLAELIRRRAADYARDAATGVYCHAHERIGDLLELGVAPTFIERCEDCGAELYEGDLGYAYQDGPTFCAKHAPTWREHRDGWIECGRDDDPERFDAVMSAAATREAVGMLDQSAAYRL